jgi:hypothetical protein
MLDIWLAINGFKVGKLSYTKNMAYKLMVFQTI